MQSQRRARGKNEEKQIDRLHLELLAAREELEINDEQTAAAQPHARQNRQHDRYYKRV
jgi:hypothetical protein